MKKFLCVILLIIVAYAGGNMQLLIQANEPAWNEIWDPNMVDLEGYDGTKYYTPKDYWVAIYNQDGSVSYRQITGGARQKRLRIVCYDDTAQTVYCIGAGLSYQYGGDKYQKEEPGVPNDYFERLPSEARQGIYLTLMFGYEDGISSPVPDTNEDDYWMATQVLIWEYQQGIRKGSEDRRNNGLVGRDIYYEIIHNSPAERCYEWIVNQIRLYLIFPSFLTPESVLYKDNNVAVQQGKDGLYTLDLYDGEHTEDVLVVLDDQGNVSDWAEIIHLGGSNYRLQVTKPVDSPVTLWVQKSVPQGHKKLTYFSDGSGETQVVVCRSTQNSAAMDVRPFTISTQDYEEIGSIRITKYAEKGSPAFPFHIQGMDSKNAHIRETVYTNSDGQGILENIPAGTYQIQEILSDESPWRKPEIQVITVEDQRTAEVVFQNVLKKGSLTICKTFEGRDTPCSDIAFEITGTYQGEIVYQKVVTTDATGNCALVDLPVGQYVIRELAGSYETWYERSEPVYIDIQDRQVAEILIHNKAKKIRLTIQKTGDVICGTEEVSGVYRPIFREEPLLTAVFDIYAEADICAEDGTVRIQKGALVDTVSGENGMYLSGLLYPGYYRIRERVCPEGYLACEDQLVLLQLDQENMIKIKNQLKPTSVHFLKSLENGTGEALNQVCFGLYMATDMVLADGTVLLKDSLLDRNYANQFGEVQLETLFAGAVYIKEIATAPGYVLDTGLYPVENGTVNGGRPLLNSRISINPKTGEVNSLPTFAMFVILAVCMTGIIAFYRKSRYNN